MGQTSETTRTVKVTAIVRGEVPALLTSERVPMPGGRTRPFSQMIEIHDAALLARLVSEVRVGDSIQVTVATVWPEEGRYYTYLVAFAAVEAAPTLASVSA